MWNEKYSVHISLKVSPRQIVCSWKEQSAGKISLYRDCMHFHEDDRSSVIPLRISYVVTDMFKTSLLSWIIVSRTSLHESYIMHLNRRLGCIRPDGNVWINHWTREQCTTKRKYEWIYSSTILLAGAQNAEHDWKCFFFNVDYAHSHTETAWEDEQLFLAVSNLVLAG